MLSIEEKAGGDFLNLKGKGFTASYLRYTFGYNFNKYLTAHIPCEGEIALFKKNGVRDWAQNSTIGLGLGIIPCRFEKVKGLLELYLAAGSTCEHKYDWRYTYYDLGFNLAFGKFVKMQAGFGIRYYDARKSANRMAGYASLGCRFN